MQNFTTISNSSAKEEFILLTGFENLKPIFAFNCGTRDGHGVIIMRNITSKMPLQKSDVSSIIGKGGVLKDKVLLKLYKKYVKDDPAEFIWIEELQCYRYESKE